MSQPNRPRALPCTRCSNDRRVYNEMLKKFIPCPQCRRYPRRDTSGINSITAAEKRRMNRLVGRAVGLIIAAASASRVQELDPYMAPVDRIMQRWAVGHGSGLPKTNEDWDRAVVKALDADVYSPEPSRPPSLDDATQAVIDRIIGVDPNRRMSFDESQKLRRQNSVPESIAAFVWQWYCSDVPCNVMAKLRGLREDEIYDEWHAVLSFLRIRFLESSHVDLVALVNGRL